MTIDRIELDHNRNVLEVTHLAPGCLETVYSPIFSGEILTLHVLSDESIKLSFYDANIETSTTLREAVTLKGEDINIHTIRSHPSFIRHRVKEYRWVPTHIHISPFQEKAIQELIETGVYTEQDAEEVRVQMVEEIRQKLDGVDPKK